jgi:hypothetical protein
MEEKKNSDLKHNVDGNGFERLPEDYRSPV